MSATLSLVSLVRYLMRPTFFNKICVTLSATLALFLHATMSPFKVIVRLVGAKYSFKQHGSFFVKKFYMKFPPKLVHDFPEIF